MRPSPLFATAAGAVLCAALCGGLGALSAIPSVIGLLHSVGAGHFGAMPPFEQGQLVGRVIGGPCSGMVCGGLAGAVLGWALGKVSGQG